MPFVLDHRFFEPTGFVRTTAKHIEAALIEPSSRQGVRADPPKNKAGHLLMKTPLHLAAESLHAAVVQELISDDALCKATDAGGRTAMHLLVMASADASRCPDDATLHGVFETLGTASDLTLKDRSGRTPLALACISANPRAKTLY